MLIVVLLKGVPARRTRAVTVGSVLNREAMNLVLNRHAAEAIEVADDVCIAAGISGAPRHSLGMEFSSRVAAINTDPDAPTLKFAHYPIAGDLCENLPMLTRAIGGGSSAS